MASDLEIHLETYHDHCIDWIPSDFWRVCRRFKCGQTLGNYQNW